MPLSDPTILLIEDSSTIRHYLRQLLLRQLPQARMVEAADGRAALNEMSRCKADLIVSDLQMPGMDGRSFIAKLRSNPLLKKKSVLVLSSDDLADLRELYKDDAGIRFLNKPAAADEILKNAFDLLGIALSSAGAPRARPEPLACPEPCRRAEGGLL